MDEQKTTFESLMNDFKKSRYGKSFYGGEHLRNTIGRMWHGFSYKHSILSKTLGVGMIAATTLAAAAAAPMLGAAASAAVVGGSLIPLTAGMLLAWPGQKEDSQFLMNVAARKAHMLNKFMQNEKGMDAASRQKAIEQCLQASMPAFCSDEYKRDFPNAPEQIANLPKDGDLPLYRNKEVFKLEAIQGVFNKWQIKGGLAQILPNVFKRTEHHARNYADKISKQMAQDYEKWKADPNPEKPSWTFLQKAYFHNVPAKPQKMPKNWSPTEENNLGGMSVNQATKKIAFERDQLTDILGKTTIRTEPQRAEQRTVQKTNAPSNVQVSDVLKNAGR